MKKFLNLVCAYICLSTSINGMETPVYHIHENSFPNEPIAQLAGYCRPYEKNILMKVCKAFNACLKNRLLIIGANPATVSLLDKQRGLFACIYSGDSRNINTWLSLVIQAGGSVDCKNSLAMTPFLVACDCADKDTMKLLLDQGANPYEYKPQIQALQQAVYRNDRKMVQGLLESKVDPNSYVYTSMPLYIATCECNVELVELLCEYGAQVNMVTETHWTLLSIATKQRHVEMVKALLKAGANPNKKLPLWHNPLYVALKNNYKEIIYLLSEYGADIDYAFSDRMTYLLTAAADGRDQMVEALINVKSNVNQTDSQGRTALYLVSGPYKVNSVKIAKLLIDAGADVHKANNNGITPLITAALHGRHTIVQLLISEGVRVDDQDERGCTALIAAAQSGDTDIVKLLLCAGANVHHKTVEGTNALFMAVQNNRLIIVRLLIYVKTNVNQTFLNGYSPLCIAAESNYLEMVKLLLSAGADKDYKNFEGKTPLQIAQEKGYEAIVEFLKRPDTTKKAIKNKKNKCAIQ